MASTTVVGMKSGTMIELDSEGESKATELGKRSFRDLTDLDKIFTNMIRGYTSGGEPVMICADKVEYMIIVRRD
jgi:hypothetical protein